MARAVPDVQNEIRKSLKKGGRYLIAVSGGIDSMVMLHACLKLRTMLGAHFEVAHIDHQLRKGSARDAAFVAAYCRENKVRFHLKHGRPPRRGNIEAWGRELRYAYFLQVCRRRKLECVLTAHNANDVAETLLMRLLSNKEPRSILRYDRKRGCSRPLLTTPRAVVEKYATVNAIKFREDPTNRDQAYLRNKVRHTLLPLLAKEFDPRIVEVLAQRAEALAEDLASLDAACECCVLRVNAYPFGSKRWVKALGVELRDVSTGQRWRLLESLLLPKLGFRLGRSPSQEAAAVVLAERPATQLPGGIELRLVRGELVLKAL